MLIGVGATAVNAYLAEAAIADRHAAACSPASTLEECLARFKEAINQGLLKIISKMGISIISSYRGGYNFEAVGLSRSLCREYLPRHPPASPASAIPASEARRGSCTRRAFAAAEPPWRSAASTASAAAARATPWRPG